MTASPVEGASLAEEAEDAAVVPVAAAVVVEVVFDAPDFDVSDTPASAEVVDCPSEISSPLSADI